MSDMFREPDVESDKKALAQSQRIDWENKFWTPKKGENLIRILPARADAPKGVSYHLKLSKHFLKFPDGSWEVFVCNLETYGKPCPACEKRIKIYKEANDLKKSDKEKAKQKSDEATRYRVSSVGYFNIIDRSEREPSVKIYEAPYSVWHRIVHLASSGGRYSDIIVALDKETGKPILENGVPKGRDVALIHNPDASAPQYRYEVIPDALSVLGSKKEVERWLEEIINLVPETFWKPIDYDEAYLRIHGSDTDRKQLRAAREAARQSARGEADDSKQTVKEEESDAAEPEFVKEATLTPKPELEKSKPEPEKPKPAQKPAPKPEPKKEPEKQKAEPEEKKEEAGEDLMATIKKRVAQLRDQK